MSEPSKAELEARALRHMAVLRFSCMVMFGTFLVDRFRGKPDSELNAFLDVAHQMIRNMERNAKDDPTMQSLIPAIESLVDDIVSSAGVVAKKSRN